MASNLDVTGAVNIDSGTIDVSPSAKPNRYRVQVFAPVARRTGPPREMAA